MSTDTAKTILFLDAYYLPETIAFTHLENDLIDGLTERGFSVRIICPVPTRNVSEAVYQAYKKKKTETDKNGKLTVRRFLAPREGKNPAVRALRYFWCNLRTYQLARKSKGIDYVFCNSTPPTQGLIAGRAAKKLHVPMIYSLQDIFPDSLATSGLTREGSVSWKIGRWIENKTYGYARDIAVISNAMKSNVEKKGVPPDKVHVISNWIDTEQVKPVPREENALYGTLSLDPKAYTVVYAGNMGSAQGVDVILDCAKLLKDEKISFLLFGGGSEYEKIAARAEREKLSNVRIMPLLPPERTKEVYSLGDAALITCKAGFGSSGMPSKTWSIMACGVPIIAAFDRQSEMEKALDAAHAGICVDPGDAAAMAKTIRDFRDRGYETRGRAYVEAYASRHSCVGQYVSLFSEKG